jgi:pyruvate/2-oxoglutarate dehydrogenase complex dihydrolipoamide dehydrogenase (E3) component
MLGRFKTMEYSESNACLVFASCMSDVNCWAAVVEEGLLGGECPFWACMPSKAILHSAKLRREVAQAHEFGAVAAAVDIGDGEAAYRGAVAWRDRIADQRDDSRHVERLESAGATLVRGRGVINAQGNVEVAGRELTGEDLVICTGAGFVKPPIEGLESLDTWTSEDVYSSPELPRSVIVLGGGPIGCEVAQVLARFGSRVVLVELAPRLIPNEEPEVTAMLAERLESDGVELHLGAKAVAASHDGDAYSLRLESGESVTAQRLVVAAGKAPRVAGIGLESIGIEPGEAGNIDTDEACRVQGKQHVWACGDVTGIAPFTHTANYQGKIIAANILGTPRVADYRALPRAVYTDPAVAGTGMTREQAEAAGIEIVVVEGSSRDTARASATGDGFGTHVMVADRQRQVLLGASGIGAGVEEFISECSLAIRAEVPLRVLADVVHPFPTHTNLYDNLFRDLYLAVGGAL